MAATNAEYIRRCYEILLSREADPEGLSTYGEALDSGRLALAGLVAAIVQSEEFRQRVAARQWPPPARPPEYAPPGHFYSPLLSRQDIDTGVALPVIEEGGAIAVSLASQVKLLERLRPYYDRQPFPKEQTAGRRFYLDNPAFCYYDAIVLHCLMRHLAPRRIVEVGSGFSSAAMLDTADQCLAGQTRFTFVEPSPTTLLEKLLQTGDQDRCTVVASEVQRVPNDVFERLQANDILFVDSSHVAKYGSDVCDILFRVIPRLRPGVVVHFHDVFANLDYPREWLLEGRAWSEAYLLRAWLSNNGDWDIVLFNDWFFVHAREWLATHMPLCLVQPSGSPFPNAGVSLWLRRRE
jgi:predicted O-methyltransferase YrrM